MRQGTRVSELTQAHVDQFLERPSRKLIARKTRASYRRQLNRYLIWLHGKRRVSFSPRLPRRLQRAYPPLPPIAEEFLASLAPTTKPWTPQGYKTCLRRFHVWLDANGTTLRRLSRRHMTEWFKTLDPAKLCPSTRVRTLVHVRVYLRWLHERRAMRAYPDDLVRHADLPKLPNYLPRPVPPEADRQLQDRLAKSDSQHHLGLLLMRRTGLRIGELRSLDYACIRNDHARNRFLKVPLGKLNNERLVPLDDSTYRLLRRLQRQGRRNRIWLLETSAGSKLSWKSLRCALRASCVGLEIPGPMTSHRLRHTYATSLLNGGMSLVGLMKLLGHRDYRMTLRYAAITDATVCKEYYEALSQVEAKYRGPSTAAASQIDPAKMLSDIVRWIQKNARQDRIARSLIKRLRRARIDLRRLTPLKR